ncbi:MAG: hypothetical protein M1528_03085 [Candidatus Marsarchaeota archaeon]|nr:hypothetical protein [Candidatus Marsarchaeota archaeon]MCL5115491.1 hypothetical protein [Candidatus Marsarchaeota archaeon]
MPLKHNITKYDVLATRIRKLSLKNGTTSHTPEEKEALITAVLIASFASGPSWQTHNALKDNISALNSAGVKEEYRQAAASKWKSISAADISEVLNKGISDGAFSTWMYFNVEQENHTAYRDAWTALNKAFLDSCDNIEVIDTKLD